MQFTDKTGKKDIVTTKGTKGTYEIRYTGLTWDVYLDNVFIKITKDTLFAAQIAIEAYDMRSKIGVLTELKNLLAIATADGILDEMSGLYTTPEVINEFCDSIAAMLTNEQGLT